MTAPVALGEPAARPWPADAKVFFIEPKNGAEIAGPAGTAGGAGVAGAQARQNPSTVTAAALLGLISYFGMKAYNKRRGIDIGNAFAEIPPE